MNYKQEIDYRKKLIEEAQTRKLTTEERCWLMTHVHYHPKWGYPYLCSDVILLKPKQKYRVQVNLDSLSYTERIVPILAVPFGKGEITLDGPVFDYNGKQAPKNKKIKMLSLVIDPKFPQDTVEFVSELGYMSIWYQCDYYDKQMQLHMRRTSDDLSGILAMSKHQIAENKFIYRCKNPLRDDFVDAMVFSVTFDKMV